LGDKRRLMKLLKPFKLLKLFGYGLFLLSAMPSNGQDFTWAKEVGGRLSTSKEPAVPGFKIKEVFNVINQIPVIANPKGYNVQEWFEKPESGPVYSTTLLINFYYYYRYQNGEVQYHNSHPPTISISINDPEDLMNSQSTVFNEETGALHSPVMFTDTFPISYKSINGYPAGEGVFTTFGRSLRIWVLNPRGRRFFRPITKEEYLKVYIEYLRKEVETGTKGLVEGRDALKEMENNELLKNSLSDFRNIQNAMTKWVDFEKSKKEYYEKKLAALTPEQKRAPAVYAIYKDVANIKDRQGNYVDRISRHLPYEPLEETKDTIVTKALFTFNEKAFDTQLPKTAIQLMVIRDAYDEGDKHFLKEFLDREFFPNIPLKQLAALMYR